MFRSILRLPAVCDIQNSQISFWIKKRFLSAAGRLCRDFYFDLNHNGLIYVLFRGCLRPAKPFPLRSPLRDFEVIEVNPKRSCSTIIIWHAPDYKRPWSASDTHMLMISVNQLHESANGYCDESVQSGWARSRDPRSSLVSAFCTCQID